MKEQIAEILRLLSKAIEQNTINTYQEQGLAADLVFEILHDVENKINDYEIKSSRRNESLFYDLCVEEFADESKEQMDEKERQELKEKLKQVMAKCNAMSWWGLTEDDYYDLLIDNGVTIRPIDK